MGKKSLLSSTSDKKTGREKSGEKGKTSIAPADAKKKATPKSSKKKSAKHTAVKKKAAPKGKTASSGAVATKVSVKPKTKAPADAKKKPVSVKDLLVRKYDTGSPETLYVPPAGPVRSAGITSPPFVTGATPEDTERIRQLLFKKFDVNTPEAEPKPVPEKLSVDRVELPPAAGPLYNDGDAHDYASIEIEAALAAKKGMAPLQKSAVAGILGLVILLALVFNASMSNRAKFYLKPVDGKIELWRGKFSPKGEKKFITLSAVSAPAQQKDSYSKEEAFSLIFENYVNQADALLTTPDTPDFELIKRTLKKALPYATSPALYDSLQKRLGKIDMMTLVYKADVLADRNTAADLTAAREALEKAMHLDLDVAEKGLVKQKLQWIDQQLAGLKKTPN